jgi:hypothetical protein
MAGTLTTVTDLDELRRAGPEGASGNVGVGEARDHHVVLIQHQPARQRVLRPAEHGESLSSSATLGPRMTRSGIHGGYISKRLGAAYKRLT